MSSSWPTTTPRPLLEQCRRGSKKEYPIPLCTNIWQNYVGEDGDNAFPVVVSGGGSPRDYPSAGGTSKALDIWQHFAPSLDFIAPDGKLNDYVTSAGDTGTATSPSSSPSSAAMSTARDVSGQLIENLVKCRKKMNSLFTDDTLLYENKTMLCITWYLYTHEMTKSVMHMMCR